MLRVARLPWSFISLLLPLVAITLILRLSNVTPSEPVQAFRNYHAITLEVKYPISKQDVS